MCYTAVFSEPRPVKCHVCDRGFKNIAALNGHMRLHGGYVRKVCLLCVRALTCVSFTVSFLFFFVLQQLLLIIETYSVVVTSFGTVGW